MDVHSKVTMICILDDGGQRLKEQVVQGPLTEVVAAMGRCSRPFKVC
jgi:hypothetical protein